MNSLRHSVKLKLHHANIFFFYVKIEQQQNLYFVRRSKPLK